jgi:hypothetical protein
LAGTIAVPRAKRNDDICALTRAASIADRHICCGEGGSFNGTTLGVCRAV